MGWLNGMKNKIPYTSTGTKRRQNACTLQLLELIVLMLNNLVTIPCSLETEMVDNIAEAPEVGSIIYLALCKDFLVAPYNSTRLFPEGSVLLSFISSVSLPIFLPS